MIFSKRLSFKLIIIMIFFVILFVIGDAIITVHSDNISIKLICKNQKEGIRNNLLSDIEVLKKLTSNIADNKDIINILSDNHSFKDIDEDEINNVIKQIDSSQDVISSIEYVDRIDIVSLKGGYSFSQNRLHNTEDLTSRSWYDESKIFSNESIVTKIHRDNSKDQLEISVLSYIRSIDKKEVLGAAIVDINLDELLAEIDNDFKLGILKSYIQLDDELYHSTSGDLLKEEIINNDKYYIESSKDIFSENEEIIFAFDRDYLYYRKIFSIFTLVKVVFLILIGLICTLVIMKITKRYFSNIMQSVVKLRVLLENLEKKNSNFDTNDEFTQLESIADSLSKSFDKKIESLIYYDELTKLPNKKMLIYRCNDLIRCNENFALIFLNLNKFKYVNDVFGHVAGDELLYNFAKKMKNIVGDRGIVTRYSGDDFIIVYKNYINDEELLQFYKETILTEFKHPIYFNNNNKLIIEFSAGVAVYPRDGQDIDELINKSDLMMHNSKEIFKKKHNSEVLFFNDKIYEKIMKVEVLKEELKNAIDKKELILYYQPLVNNEGKIKKVEALIRWNSEKLGFVSPVDFISYAEETGEIIKIGYWIIEEVCKNFHVFYNDGNIIQVSINVSPIQLIEYDFVENVTKILDKYCIDYSSLCFEITESVVLDENIIVYNNLHKLNEIGIKIALDDFGTGYSSFSYLKKFKLDILKLDKIFIDNGEEVDYKIVNNIKEIAQLLNMEIVVEGVETKEQFEILNSIGCHLFQGYYFSKPLPLQQLEEFIKNN